MMNITFNELQLISENNGLKLVWCNHDNWDAKRSFEYIEELSAFYPSDIKIVMNSCRNIKIYYKDTPIQEYIVG